MTAPDPSPNPASASPRPAPDRGPWPWLATARRGLSAGFFLALGGLAWWWLTTHHFTSVEPDDHAATPKQEQAGDGETSATTIALVTLPATPAAREAIAVAPVETRPLREHLTVPGRLDYDDRSRIDYESPVDGIVSRMFVTVRQRVAKGDPLAEVSSPEVGTARDEVRKRQADREIQRKATEWATTIAGNVQSLLTVLADHPPLDDVEKQFEGRLLGAYREKILGAYSRLVYVEKVDAGTRQLSVGGMLSGRIVEERTSNLEVARSAFNAACEEARFETLQERDKATAALDQSDRLLQVATESLRTLVGSRLEAGDAAITGDDDGTESISSIALKTPFDGVVDEIFVSRGERVTSGERLFVVADPSRLWARAQIHEKQWTTVEVGEGQEVSVVVPGATEHRATARINHVAATVDAASRSVSLVAELTNDDAHYKPGMFVWVELPQGELRDALAVPVESVMRHEGKAFVFVPEGADRYRRVDIEPGIEEDGFVEVKRGLEAGQRVVSKGAFLLKSELLLEDEG
jgi:cobalt-zinc-cadmium efflux system membrane fusion protein